MIRIALVEDDPGTREGLVRLLSHAPQLVYLAACADAEEAEREIPRLLPDVVLMDIHLGRASGIHCVARLKRAHPQLQFLMLTTYDDSELIFQSLQAGASGYLLKRSAGTELVAAIEEAHRGGAPMSMQIARKVVIHFQQREARAEHERLTSLETEILALLAKGQPTGRIAERLGIGPGAIRAHLHTIYGKLHGHSRGLVGSQFSNRETVLNDTQNDIGAGRRDGEKIGPNGLYPSTKQ